MTATKVLFCNVYIEELGTDRDTLLEELHEFRDMLSPEDFSHWVDTTNKAITEVQKHKKGAK